MKYCAVAASGAWAPLLMRRQRSCAGRPSLFLAAQICRTEWEFSEREGQGEKKVISPLQTELAQ